MPVLKNAKHELFAQEVARGKSAAEAFVLAGYKPHESNSARLSGNERVRSRIEEILSASAQKAGVTVERVLQEYAKIAFADITDAVVWGEAIAVKDADGGDDRIVQGVHLLDAADLPKHVTAAISEVKQTKEGLSVKFHSKTAALDALGKHLGMFKDKVEITGKDGGPVETKELSNRDRAKALAALLAKVKARE
jgi:phage terminase small subunit